MLRKVESEWFASRTHLDDFLPFGYSNLRLMLHRNYGNTDIRFHYKVRMRKIGFDTKRNSLPSSPKFA